MTEADKIIQWCKSQLGIGKNEWAGKCQAFVSYAYKAGTGKMITFPSAKAGRNYSMISGTADDLKPPRGAACYFNGTGAAGAQYGHVAISDGNGLIYEAWSSGVYMHRLYKDSNGGYLGWGWHGNIKPQGENKTTTTTVNSVGNSYSDTAKTQTVEISTVVIKSESGSLSSKQTGSVDSIDADSDLFLLVQGEDRIYKPLWVDEVKVSRERTGAPGKMTFSYVDAEDIHLAEGNAVAFRYKNQKVFFGYIFTLERDSDREKVSVTCYDQLRYFKNKDTLVYSGRYSDLLKNLCKKYGFAYDVIEDTGYKIPERVEDGTLFDICSTATGLTLVQNGKYFVLYDDFGKLNLKSIENMMLPILIDKDTTGEWKHKVSIDSDVYNRIIVKRDNSQTGERELYIANDSSTQSKWGVLSYTDDGDENSSAASLKARAAALLKYYNRPNKTFSVSDCFGHADVRGGSSLVVYFDIGNGEKIKQLMVVDKVEHTFSEGCHLMDMNLYGGVYSA